MYAKSFAPASASSLKAIRAVAEESCDTENAPAGSREGSWSKKTTGSLPNTEESTVTAVPPHAKIMPSGFQNAMSSRIVFASGRPSWTLTCQLSLCAISCMPPYLSDAFVFDWYWKYIMIRITPMPPQTVFALFYHSPPNAVKRTGAKSQME